MPGLLPVWRDRDTLQVGIDSRRAIALTGLGRAAAVVGLLDGSRDRDRVVTDALASGVPETTTSHVLGLLAAAGALNDFPAQFVAALPESLRAPLAPELATAAVAYGDGDAGARVLARRRAAYVRVHGTGRVAASIAGLLAASGVGDVACEDLEPADCADHTVAGPGAQRASGATRAERPARAERPPLAERPPRASEAGQITQGTVSKALTGAKGRPPDLAVLAEYPGQELAASLMRERVSHLAVRASEAIGIVGPLVEPGRSACLRCIDLAKTERDPAWPLILAQLAGARHRPQGQPQACDTVLAATVAAAAAGRALAYIDRAAPDPAVTNGTLELVLPDWEWRRRSWLPHSACTCHGSR
jgi:hypothetical protein